MALAKDVKFIAIGGFCGTGKSTMAINLYHALHNKRLIYIGKEDCAIIRGDDILGLSVFGFSDEKIENGDLLIERAIDFFKERVNSLKYDENEYKYVIGEWNLLFATEYGKCADIKIGVIADSKVVEDRLWAENHTWEREAIKTYIYNNQKTTEKYVNSVAVDYTISTTDGDGACKEIKNIAKLIKAGIAINRALPPHYTRLRKIRMKISTKIRNLCRTARRVFRLCLKTKERRNERTIFRIR